MRNGYPPQTNIARVDGQRAALMVDPEDRQRLDARRDRQRSRRRSRACCPSLPPNLEVKPLADQSLFVRASIEGVLREAVIAACLTALMILVFLGSWRSTLIIAVSIPLSILSSIIVLSALGETINIMTLGGLALAVGILVDDATVAIENINSHLEQGKDLEPAILDGAQQIAIPAFVSTICICIVFVPMFFLTGVARYLFVPMAEAVVFAMLASYVLSRTLVPTMAKYLLKAHAPTRTRPTRAATRSCGCSTRFDRGFLRLRDGYRGAARAGGRRAAACSRLLFLAGCVVVAGARPLGRRGLLPVGRQRPVQAAPARADRHAHRGDGGALRPRRAGDPRGDSGDARSSASSTTSGCRTAASTCRTRTRRRSDRRTPTSW